MTRWRQIKGAVKLHLWLDHNGYLPIFGRVSEGKVADLKVAQSLDFPKGNIVALDRDYTGPITVGPLLSHLTNLGRLI